MESAISREKALKFWQRVWKVRLIEQLNPNWRDLYPEILGLDSGLRQNDEQGTNT
jgi:putative endonuclease